MSANRRKRPLPFLVELTDNAKPGQFGNLYSYYSRKKASPWEDDRLASFPDGFFARKRILYIGCHEGYLPIQLALTYKAGHVTAVDIDPKLVLKATKNAALVDRVRTMDAEEMKEHTFDYLSDRDSPFFQGFLSSQRMDKVNRPIFDMVRFLRQNAADLDSSLRQGQFDIVCCFKVTKYVHLNFGDDGIRRLFEGIYEALAPRGVLLLQPQSLKSYSKMKSFCPQFQETFPTIRLQPEKFRGYLESELGMEASQVAFRKGTETKRQKSPGKPDKVLVFIKKN